MFLAALLSFVRSYIQSWRYPVHVILVESTYNVQFKLPPIYQNYLCELPRTKRAELLEFVTLWITFAFYFAPRELNYLTLLRVSTVLRNKRIWRVPAVLQWFLIRLYMLTTLVLLALFVTFGHAVSEVFYRAQVPFSIRQFFELPRRLSVNLSSAKPKLQEGGKGGVLLTKHEN